MLFLRFILRVVRGYIVHLVFEPKFAWHFAYRKYTLWQSCLPSKESHTALISYFELLIFHAKNEDADMFFVIKPKTGRISLFNAAI